MYPSDEEILQNMTGEWYRLTEDALAYDPETLSRDAGSAAEENGAEKSVPAAAKTQAADAAQAAAGKQTADAAQASEQAADVTDALMLTLPTGETYAESWQINNDQQANWAISKIREAEKEKQEWADFYRRQAEKWSEQADQTIAFFTEHLRRYFAKVPHKCTKTQESYELPDGKLIYKAQQPEYRRDDRNLLVWLKQSEMPEYIKVEEKPDWAKLKAECRQNGDALVYKDTGEVVPFVSVVNRDPVFSVKMAEEA